MSRGVAEAATGSGEIAVNIAGVAGRPRRPRRDAGADGRRGRRARPHVRRTCAPGSPPSRSDATAVRPTRRRRPSCRRRRPDRAPHSRRDRPIGRSPDSAPRGARPAARRPVSPPRPTRRPRRWFRTGRCGPRSSPRASWPSASRSCSALVTLVTALRWAARRTPRRWSTAAASSARAVRGRSSAQAGPASAQIADASRPSRPDGLGSPAGRDTTPRWRPRIGTRDIAASDAGASSRSLATLPAPLRRRGFTMRDDSSCRPRRPRTRRRTTGRSRRSASPGRHTTRRPRRPSPPAADDARGAGRPPTPGHRDRAPSWSSVGRRLVLALVAALARRSPSRAASCRRSGVSAVAWTPWPHGDLTVRAACRVGDELGQHGRAPWTRRRSRVRRAGGAGRRRRRRRSRQPPRSCRRPRVEVAAGSDETVGAGGRGRGCCRAGVAQRADGRGGCRADGCLDPGDRAERERGGEGGRRRRRRWRSRRTTRWRGWVSSSQQIGNVVKMITEHRGADEPAGVERDDRGGAGR